MKLEEQREENMRKHQRRGSDGCFDEAAKARQPRRLAVVGAKMGHLQQDTEYLKRCLMLVERQSCSAERKLVWRTARKDPPEQASGARAKS